MIKSTLACLGLMTFIVALPAERWTYYATRCPRFERIKLDSCPLIAETPRKKISYQKLQLVSNLNTATQQVIDHSPKEDSKK